MPGEIGEGDALITGDPALFVSVRTADCVPILLADPEHHTVAAVHSGWRGTAAAIVRRAIEAMALQFASDPSHLVAAIGPSIGPCCYEVGPEVVSQFGTLFPEWNSPDHSRNIDLVEANQSTPDPGRRTSSEHRFRAILYCLWNYAFRILSEGS